MKDPLVDAAHLGWLLLPRDKQLAESTGGEWPVRPFRDQLQVARARGLRSAGRGLPQR